MKANHCINSGQEGPMKFTLGIRVMKKCDLSGLSECGMNDGAR